MSQHSNLSRRTAIAGLGAGSLAALFGATAAANPYTSNRETGGAAGTSVSPLLEHALAGRWLAMVGLPSNEFVNVAVPTILGTDGTAIMIFPGTEAAKRGIEIKGVALGEWKPVDDDTGHFTVVQVLSNLDGGYLGTVTVDGEATLSHDRLMFWVGATTRFYTIRDQSNTIIEELATSGVNPMRAFRMGAGNAGFPDRPLPRLDDPVPSQ